MNSLSISYGIEWLGYVGLSSIKNSVCFTSTLQLFIIVEPWSLLSNRLLCEPQYTVYRPSASRLLCCRIVTSIAEWCQWCLLMGGCLFTLHLESHVCHCCNLIKDIYALSNKYKRPFRQHSEQASSVTQKNRANDYKLFQRMPGFSAEHFSRPFSRCRHEGKVHYSIQRRWCRLLQLGSAPRWMSDSQWRA